MKVKGQFVLRNIEEEAVLVPIGETAMSFNGIITMTETGAFIWDLVEQNKSRDEILKSLIETYDVDNQQAKADLDEFLDGLINDGFVIEE